MKRQRILMASVDTGFRMQYYAKYIRNHLSKWLAVDTYTTFVYDPKHYETTYTYSMPSDKTPKLRRFLFGLKLFVSGLLKYDIYHFISGETLLPRRLVGIELFTYRLFRKKIFIHFVGADIRSVDYLFWRNECMEECLSGKCSPHPISELNQKRLVAVCEKYADKIFVSSPDLLKIIPSASFVPVMIDLEDFEESKKKQTTQKAQPDVIRILHSPSGAKTKGSRYIHNALVNLKKKYGSKIELVLPGSMGRDNYDYAMVDSQQTYALSRYELLETLHAVDIVIDQMIIGWYGLKSVEALLAGCEVVCYIEKDVEGYLFPESPIVNANVLNLEASISDLVEKLMSDNNRIHRIERNEKWVKMHHTLHANSYLVKNWNERNISIHF